MKYYFKAILHFLQKLLIATHTLVKMVELVIKQKMDIFANVLLDMMEPTVNMVLT